MLKFRKKPVVIEAIKYNGIIGTANYILSRIGDHGAKAKRAHNTKPEAGIVINTLEGDMTAIPGDWIIKGIKGEFYPCKPEIFAATYDPVIEEDEFTCIGCGNVIQEGELVFHEYGEGGLIHAECLGSDRESYCNDDGEPLGPDDPLPKPFPYIRAEYFPIAGKSVVGDGWQPIESAPRDRTSVIVAVPAKEKEDGFIVGEAYYDPENYEGGDWWWAGTSHAEHFDSPISEINHHAPTHWRSLPPAPSQEVAE